MKGIMNKEYGAVAVRPQDLRMSKRLTLDATSMKHLNQVVCVALSELYYSDMPGFDAARTPTPTAMVDIRDLQSGEEWALITGSVLASTLKRKYETITGRYFAIQAHDIMSGKRYRKVEAVELELAK